MHDIELNIMAVEQDKNNPILRGRDKTCMKI